MFINPYTSVYRVKAISEAIVMATDVINSLKTLLSNRLRFCIKRKMAASRMALITYSLAILKVVSPVPSMKQAGKIFQ